MARKAPAADPAVHGSADSAVGAKRPGAPRQPGICRSAASLRRSSPAPTTIAAWGSIVVLLEPIVERALPDAEKLRGALAVAADDIEGVQDRLALELRERTDLVGL